jgi:glutathione S-transferase
MKLIGMLDSPYVRRVAVSLKVLGLPFELDQLSVFRNFEQFSAINPVVKAPTLVTDDGVVLMESSVILDHIASIAPRSLMPRGAPHAVASRQVGLALAACEKSVSIVYELNTRPAEKQHQPWLDRVVSQLNFAYAALEAEIPNDWCSGEELMQPQITTAVAWRFTQHTSPGRLAASGFPKLAALSARAEALPAFRETNFTEAVFGPGK